MTRGYAILKTKDAELKAYLGNSAYPSWYGHRILAAAHNGTMQDFIDEENSESTPEERALMDTEQVDFVYTYEEWTKIFTVQDMQNLVRTKDGRTIPQTLYRVKLPEQFELFEFIMKHEEEIGRQLCISDKTLMLTRDYESRKAIRAKVKEGWTVSEFEKLLTQMRKRVYFPDESREEPKSLAFNHMPHGYQNTYVRNLSVFAPVIPENSLLEKEPSGMEEVSYWHTNLFQFKQEPYMDYSARPTCPKYRVQLTMPHGTVYCGAYRTRMVAASAILDLAKQYELILPHVAHALEAYQKASRCISGGRASRGAAETLVKRACEIIEQALPPDMGELFPDVSAEDLCERLEILKKSTWYA